MTAPAESDIYFMAPSRASARALQSSIGVDVILLLLLCGCLLLFTLIATKYFIHKHMEEAAVEHQKQANELAAEK